MQASGAGGPWRRGAAGTARPAGTPNPGRRRAASHTQPAVARAWRCRGRPVARQPARRAWRSPATLLDGARAAGAGSIRKQANGSRRARRAARPRAPSTPTRRTPGGGSGCKTATGRVGNPPRPGRVTRGASRRLAAFCGGRQTARCAGSGGPRGSAVRGACGSPLPGQAPWRCRPGSHGRPQAGHGQKKLEPDRVERPRTRTTCRQPMRGNREPAGTPAGVLLSPHLGGAAATDSVFPTALGARETAAI